MGFEQVCHRVKMLSRPGAAGIPFHLQASARNPGEEMAATGYFRDPLHFGDAANADLGGPSWTSPA